MIIRKIFLLPILWLLPLYILFTGCAKNESGDRGQTHLQVYLTDDPGDYEEVIIDVKDIQVNLSSDGNEGWESLVGVNAGTYDLLKLVNERDTLLADATIPAGRIHQLRLVLGDENYVKVHGTSIRLTRLADQQSGLRLGVQQDVANGSVYKILLDFDVSRSIDSVDVGTYNLRPVIRTVFEAVGGSVGGWVVPGTFRTGVYAIQGADTVTGTFTDEDGGYSIKGIAQGQYSLYFNSPDSVYRDSLLTDVSVVNREVTIIDTMFLQP